MRTPAIVITCFSLATASLAMTGAANAEPCNPIIDGTHCATQMPKKRTSTSSHHHHMRPIHDMSRTVPSSTVGGNQPATLGGISIRGNSRCIAGLRRSSCD